MLDVRDRLRCFREQHGAFASQLELLSREGEKGCGRLTRRLQDFLAGSEKLGPNRWRWHGHEWTYRSEGHSYSLSVIDLRDPERYGSFWLDDSGVLRSWRGRPATPHDPQLETQTAFPDV